MMNDEGGRVVRLFFGVIELPPEGDDEFVYRLSTIGLSVSI